MQLIEIEILRDKHTHERIFQCQGLVDAITDCDHLNYALRAVHFFKSLFMQTLRITS